MYIAGISDTQSARLTKAVLLAQKQKDNQLLHDLTWSVQVSDSMWQQSLLGYKVVD